MVLIILKLTPSGALLSVLTMLKVGGGILHTRDMILQIYGDDARAETALATCVAANGNFLVSKAYELIRPHYAKIRWAKAIWNPNIILKHSFIATVAAQGRLPTVDNLNRRGLLLANWCVLCKKAMETHAHLFFHCEFAATL
ncbi:uncharacterized protein LOC141618043 [Silene latifolia]|uniref:uncharacterized protein LOC141618043 n=1 Tax=Silene latifolia TaxID=37657 RepID=UPI003D788067